MARKPAHHHHPEPHQEPPSLSETTSDLRRIGVAIDAELLDKFDALIAKRGYTNRSEAFRDLIRAELVDETARNPNRVLVGTLTIVYDHHVRLLSEHLTELQHQAFALIRSTLHIHLDHDHCLEVIVLQGKARELQKISDALISVKGVKHGKLTITTPNIDLA